jgi:hypothetical protein
LLIALAFPLEVLRTQESLPTQGCAPVVADSARFGSAPVFAECEVERPATLRRSPKPRAPFPSGVRCLIAELEFVVDERGAPIASTAALLNATTPDFGAAALRSLGRWDYVPAQQKGVPVRQLVVGRIAFKDARLPFVILEPGERPPPRTPEPLCQ